MKIALSAEARGRLRKGIYTDYVAKVRKGILEPLANKTGDSCLLWATVVLKRDIPSLKICSDYELSFLRDALNGRPTKIGYRLRCEFQRCGITAPDLWIAALARRESFQAWRGKTVNTLPVSQLYRLLKMLQRRKGAA